MLPLRLSRLPSPMLDRRVEIREGDHLLHAKRYQFRNGYEDLSDLRSISGRLHQPDGEEVILVNAYEDETTYRRWAPIKWAKATYERQGARCWLSAPGRLVNEIDEMTEIEYAGDLFASLQVLEQQLPETGPVVLTFAWGMEESLRHLPAEEFSRTLDLAIDRLRKRNPSLQVVIPTPPPQSGEEKRAAAYASTLRRLAREHHTGLIDLHARTLAQPEWPSMYRLEEDPTVLSQWLSSSGQARMREWLVDVVAAPREIETEGHLPVVEEPVEAHRERFACQFPGVADWAVRWPIGSQDVSGVSFDLYLPPEAPIDLQVNLALKDKDGVWFQASLPQRLTRGAWSHV